MGTPFAALAHQYRDTFRLALRPAMIGRLAVTLLALVTRAAGRAPAEPQHHFGSLSG